MWYPPVGVSDICLVGLGYHFVGRVVGVEFAFPGLVSSVRWVTIRFGPLGVSSLFDLVQVKYGYYFRVPLRCPTIGSDVSLELETGVRLWNIASSCVGAN